MTRLLVVAYVLWQLSKDVCTLVIDAVIAERREQKKKERSK